jgi:hypothetical protein
MRVRNSFIPEKSCRPLQSDRGAPGFFLYGLMPVFFGGIIAGKEDLD